MNGLLGSLLAGVVGGMVALLLQALFHRLRAAARFRAEAREGAPSKGIKRFWIKLTPEQKEEIRIATGEDLEALGYSEADILAAQRAPKLPREKHLHGLWVALGLDD